MTSFICGRRSKTIATVFLQQIFEGFTPVFISLKAFFISETKLLYIFAQERDEYCTRITDLVFAFTFAGANHFVTLQTTL